MPVAVAKARKGELALVVVRPIGVLRRLPLRAGDSDAKGEAWDGERGAGEVDWLLVVALVFVLLLLAESVGVDAVSCMDSRIA